VRHLSEVSKTYPLGVLVDHAKSSGRLWPALQALAAREEA
jgi:hypothetical protein